MGIIDHVGTMPDQKNKRREAGCQRHSPQRVFGERRARRQIERRIKLRRRLLAGMAMIEAERIAKQLCAVDRARGLDKGKGGHRRELETAPGTPRARQDAGRFIRIRLSRAA